MIHPYVYIIFVYTFLPSEFQHLKFSKSHWNVNIKGNSLPRPKNGIFIFIYYFFVTLNSLKNSNLCSARLFISTITYF